MFSGWFEAARLKSARTAEVASGPIGAPRSPTCRRSHDFTWTSDVKPNDAEKHSILSLYAEAEVLRLFARFSIFFVGKISGKKKSCYANRKIKTAWPNK
jgi:hypothetical protein